MKKLFALAVVALSMLAATATAQVKLGVKGGLNVTNMSLDKEVFDADNRAGWFIGPTIKVSLPLTGLSLDAAALYDQRSAKITESNTSLNSETLKQQSIQIPINVRYGVGLGSTASVFAFAGPQFGFNVGDDYKDINWEWKSSNFSVNVGLGMSLLNHLQVTANYNIACGTTGEVSVGNVAEGVGKGVLKGKNSAWQIGLAYYF